MTDRERINFFPSEEDAELIAEQIAFHGGDNPDALRRGLRAAHREIDLLKHAHQAALKAATPKAKPARRK